MDRSSDQSKSRMRAIALARRLEELGADSVVALDVSGHSPFTDYFVIAGANSRAQMRGFRRRVFDLLEELQLEARQGRKRDDDGGWLLIDCSSVIVHIMLREQREFYDLEKLWFDAETIYAAETRGFDDSAPQSDV